jgi:DNA-directed RNA polymerase sigma subunit (sigma70/sigma32)
MRFGIGADKPMTLEEVGKHYGVTRERIRQVENKAIRKLRNPMRANMLREAMV